MWPFRAERLTDVLPRDDIRQLLALGASAGTTLVLVARTGEDSFEAFRAEIPEGERGPDPFCEYFRRGQHGSVPAFAGADEACARDEERFVRRLFPPPGAAPLVLDDSGTAKHRCHMGLTDYLVPVEVGGRALGAIVGGRRVEAEEDRLRIRKSVGKLGKLTRAEAESAGDQPPIAPADEKARDRLLHEIQEIPATSPEFVGTLRRIGALFSRIATARFDASRWVREDPVLDAIAAPDGTAVANLADLRKDLEGVLARLREELAFEHLAFFAPAAGAAAGGDAPLPLVAAWGLAVDPGRRLLEIDWAKLPPPQPDPSREFFRGVQAASSASRVFVAADVPKWLKETLSRSAFLYPVELAPARRAAVLFGPARSSVPPEDADYRFLERVAKALARRYYARAAEADRCVAVEKLARVEEAARAAEEARKTAEEKLREEEERKKLEERTRGFVHFNFSKLVEQCVAAIAPKARELGIEFDSRAVPERLMYDGDRRRLARAIEEVLSRCVARTRSDPPSAKPAPVRVFVRRGRKFIAFGAEALGEYVTRE
ncbi:MAG: PocR ligand-binding domain-containing protein, partial [Planctomycetota bacterium]